MDHTRGTQTVDALHASQQHVPLYQGVLEMPLVQLCSASLQVASPTQTKRHVLLVHAIQQHNIHILYMKHERVMLWLQ